MKMMVKRKINSIEKRIDALTLRDEIAPWALDHARAQARVQKQKEKEYLKGIHQKCLEDNLGFPVELAFLIPTFARYKDGLGLKYYKEHKNFERTMNGEGLEKWGLEKLTLLLKDIDDYDTTPTEKETMELAEEYSNKFSSLKECIDNERFWEKYKEEFLKALKEAKEKLESEETK